MADVDEIIDYIKSLKKGFDKDLFQSKIDELAFIVDNNGLEYDDFHKLFRVWLNLSIPITKWVSIGVCLVPKEQVEERTVEYALRWLLTNYQNHTSFSRIGFLLDWLTAALDSEAIDLNALDSGYEVFFVMLTYEALTAHALKLVHSLTKPDDVTRRRVLKLFDCAKKRENKKNMLRQIQVLLGLFKSFRPEYVPEDIPAVSIHTSFKKINISLLSRFKKNQEHRNNIGKQFHHLLWTNPFNSQRNKKAVPLVPSMEFINIGSKQYADNEHQKNYLDFTDAAGLVGCSLRRSMPRPARLRALLQRPGLVLLAAAPPTDHAFFAHDLAHLLANCFLERSPHSYAEKQMLLRRLDEAQRTLIQAIPSVTAFLAKYLPLADDEQFFPEILDLAEWVCPETDYVSTYIVEPLMNIAHRSEPIEQCAILKCLTNMYCNIVYTSKRKQLYFGTEELTIRTKVNLQVISSRIHCLCANLLQADPGDFRIQYTTLQVAEKMTRTELALCSPPNSWPKSLALAMPLLEYSAALLDKIIGLIILYKKLFAMMKSNNIEKTIMNMEHLKELKGYTFDIIRCLYGEQAISGRESGIIFQNLRPHVAEKLMSLIPAADASFSLRNNLAFAPYTYLKLEAIDYRDADNKLWFDAIINQEFKNISNVLKKTVPELR